MDITTLYKIPMSVPDADVYARMDADAALVGIPDEVWSLLRTGLLSRYRMSGSLAGMHRLADPFNDAAPEHGFADQYPHKVIDLFERSFDSQTQCSFYITGREDWWKGEHCFFVSDAASFAKMLHHTVLTTTPALRDWTPAAVKEPKGRSKSDGLYNAWKEHCRAQRALVAAHKAQTAERVAALWAAAKEFEAKHTVTFEQYKQDHEG